MVHRIGLVAALVAALVIPSPTAAAGRRASRVLIRKEAHTLQLLAQSSSGEEVLATYKVAIGPGGAGPKRQEGDQVTPVGRYHVTTHFPSQYRVFLGLDYPNAADVQRFAAAKNRGELPKESRIGGSIGIHGPPVSLAEPAKSALKAHDWTLGCIAVDDDEIRAIARLVPDGTPVDIED